MNKKTYFILTTLIMLMFASIAYSSYLSFYPFKTLVVHSTTVTQSIKAGDTLIYTVDYCKYTDKPATVFRTLHKADESEVVPYPAVSTISVKGCNIAKVPLKTFGTETPGEYYLLIDANFSFDGGRDIHVQYKTNNFKIL